MTEQQAKEFFEKVKDTAIKWTGWDDDQYFIPRELVGSFNLFGDLCYRNTLETSKRSFYVSCGFNPDDFGKYRWKFLPITNHLRESAKCSMETIKVNTIKSDNIYDILNIKESQNMLILDKEVVEKIRKYIAKLENENKLYKAIAG
jgi:hypothetical protein